jgi:hypothetical protein
MLGYAIRAIRKEVFGFQFAYPLEEPAAGLTSPGDGTVIFSLAERESHAPSRSVQRRRRIRRIR